jgi:hypothetical protein
MINADIFIRKQLGKGRQEHKRGQLIVSATQYLLTSVCAFLQYSLCCRRKPFVRYRFYCVTNKCREDANAAMFEREGHVSHGGHCGHGDHGSHSGH